MTTNAPLPIAALALRARNAKSAKERHDLAYFAWEASVRLAVSARPPADRSGLGMPSTGHWVSALAPDDTIYDDAALLAAQALFVREGQDKASAPKSTTLARVFEPMPSYRNKIIGHGSVKAGEFYEQAGETLLAGVERLWELGAIWPRDARLVYVDTIEIVDSRDSAGKRRARVLVLAGPAGRVLDPRGTAVGEDVLPRRLYIEEGGAFRSLHPWLLYQAAELSERVLFFNGRGRASKYLDYVGGEQVKGKDIAADIETALDGVIAARGDDKDKDAERDPNRFGDYQLLGKLGEGGMGVVYLARQDSLGRLVALKMLPPGAGEDPIIVARFKREIAALARCEHPNIVKILASGFADGRHYYAMELVEGADLAGIAQALPKAPDFDSAVSTASERVRTAKADAYAHLPKVVTSHAPAIARKPADRVRALVALFRDAARGVEHLHELGILHRDIKPGNLMVTDGDHRVVIMDLGLAAIGDASQALTKDKTSLLGTLRYMPPEQLQRNLLKLDRRADVYSLGATFYELLCGGPMFDGDNDARLLEQVLRETPVPPRVANPDLPRDVATILGKATEKDARMRYDSAGALADDLDAFLAGRPIAARPPTFGYLIGLAIRKHRALAATVLAAVVLAVAGGAFFIIREHALRNEAQANLEQLLEEQGRTQLLAGNPTIAAIYLSQLYSMGQADAPTRALLADAMRPIDACTLHHKAPIQRASWSRNGTRVITASDDGTASLWDVDHCTLVRAFTGHSGQVVDAQLSPDGAYAVTASKDKTARVWNVATGESVTLAGHDKALNTARFSPDGARVVTGSSDGTARVWDARTGKELAKLVGHANEVYTAVFSPDGAQVLTTGVDWSARVWDASTGTELHKLPHDGFVTGGAFSHDGTRIATSGKDRNARVWDAATGAVLATCEGHTDTVYGVTFSPDDKRLVTASWDHSARVWALDGGRCVLVATLAGHLESVMGAQFTPDGARVVTASDDRSARLWDAKSGEQLAAFTGHDDWVLSLDLSPDGAHMITTSLDATARVWDVRPPKLVSALHVEDPAHTIDGERVLGASGTVRDTATGKTIATLDHGGPTVWRRLVGDGRAVTAGADGSVKIWDAGTGRVVATVQVASKAELLDAAPSPDGKLLATSANDRTVAVWDVATGAQVARLEGHADLVRRLAFSRDGTRVVTASDDHTARIWDARTGRLLQTLAGHRYLLNFAVFSPDGTRVVTASNDHTARLWDAASGKLIAELEGHRSWVRTTAFDATGDRIVTASGDGTAKVWDGRNGKLLASLDSSGPLSAAAFTADGSRVATANTHYDIELWDVHLESRPPDEIAKRIAERVRLQYVHGVVLPK